MLRACKFHRKNLTILYICIIINVVKIVGYFSMCVAIYGLSEESTQKKPFKSSIEKIFAL